MPYATLLLCLVATGAIADDTTWAYGEGVQSCGSWLSSSTDQVGRLLKVNWVLGWISAAGYYQVSGTLKHTDVAAMTAWVDGYCKGHPIDDLKDAAVALTQELAKRGKT